MSGKRTPRPRMNRWGVFVFEAARESARLSETGSNDEPHITVTHSLADKPV